MKTTLLLMAFAVLSGCVTTTPPLPNPTVRVGHSTLDVVRSRIIEHCAQKDLTVYETGSNQVICGKTITGFDGYVARKTIGNEYSTNPEVKARFVFFQSGDDVGVTADGFAETQMAMGQIRRIPVNDQQSHDSLQAFLYSLQ